jgi:hypothetical protein
MTAAFSAVGRTAENRLIVLALAGKPQEGIPQANVQDVAQTLLALGAMEALLLGGSMDVQQWIAGEDGPGVLGWHNQPPHQAERHLNHALLVYIPSPASAGLEEVRRAAPSIAVVDLGLGPLGLLFGPDASLAVSVALTNTAFVGVLPDSIAEASGLEELFEKAGVSKKRYGIESVEAYGGLEEAALAALQNRFPGVVFHRVPSTGLEETLSFLSRFGIFIDREAAVGLEGAVGNYLDSLV